MPSVTGPTRNAEIQGGAWQSDPVSLTRPVLQVLRWMGPLYSFSTMCILNTKQSEKRVQKYLQGKFQDCIIAIARHILLKNQLYILLDPKIS